MSEQPWSAPRSGPLRGVSVVDFTHAAAGPFCTQHLGDLGATVTKVEPPGGDMVRPMDDEGGDGLGTYFQGLNRNKRFMRLDLSSERGRAIGRALCLGADAVVENFRPGVMARLGLGYEDLQPDAPGLVYTSISAFGEQGPLRDKPGMDIILQAFGGIMGSTGLQDGPPVKVGAPVADLATGYAAAMGTVAALFERQASGAGQRVSVSLLNVVTSLLSNVTTGHLLTGREVPRLGSAHPQLVPYQAFRTADDEYLVIGILNERFWIKLCDLLADPRIADDPRFRSNADRVRHRQVLIPLLEQALVRRPVAVWEELCEQYDVPHTRVNTLGALFAHPQADAEQLVLHVPSAHGPVPTLAPPNRFSRTPREDHAAPAVLGAHTAQVLTELGYSVEQITELRDEGVI